ncbi:hypothetical protein [Burkholderia catarinensis]|uniref:hypothetical protein n=1 Tax=Burkholderia catarinensis TaxID=1108140 RepID=UPI001C568ABA|nr:hypothetical protein [Burkholderia catarinensis]
MIQLEVFVENNATTSPIENLRNRVDRLDHWGQLTFAAFCAQSTLKNIDIYEKSSNIPNGWGFEPRMDPWFWNRIKNRETTCPFKFESLAEELDGVTEWLSKFPLEHNIEPAPSDVMSNSAVYVFISCCALFSGEPEIGELLLELNGCLSSKIDYYYNFYLKMKFYDFSKDSFDKIYEFPVYQSAVNDLNWVLGLIELDGNSGPSTKTLGMIRTYAQNCDSFVVDRPMFID